MFGILLTAFLLAPPSTPISVEDLGKTYTPDPDRTPPALMHAVADDAVIHGNTSFRNETPATLE